MGPGVPSLAVSSRVLGSRPSPPGCFSRLRVHSARVSSDLLCLTPCRAGGPARVSSSLLVNLLLTPWLTASLSALLPVAGLRPGLCFVNAPLASLQALGTDTNGYLRRAAPRHGPHDSTSHEPPAMAPPPRLSGVASCEPFSVASRGPSSVTSHVTRLCSALCHQPSLAAPAEWSAACVTSFTLSAQHWDTARSSTCYYTPASAPLSSLSRSAMVLTLSSS